jgi:hypothetical protein
MKGPCPTPEHPENLCGWCDYAEQCEERRNVPEPETRTYIAEDVRDALMGMPNPELEAVASIVLNQPPFRQAATAEGFQLRRDHLLIVVKSALQRLDAEREEARRVEASRGGPSS